MKLFPNYFAIATNKQMKNPKLGAFALKPDECRDCNEAGYDIFWTMNGFDFGKRTKADLKWINCFYADLDVGSFQEMKQRIKSCPMPSSIIQTGKGYHLYWWLKQEIDCSDNPEQRADWFRTFMINRIVPALNSDPQAADACRLLRAPFFKYWKDGLGEKHSDIVFESDKFYELSFLEKYFPEKKIEQIEFPKFRRIDSPEGDFWTKANVLPVRESLDRLSGTTHVNFEVYTYRKQKNLVRILVNGKPSNAWIDPNGLIGSTASAGPAIPNWLFFYLRDWKKVAMVIKDIFQIQEQK